MNHNQDYDRDGAMDDVLNEKELMSVLKESFETENELMRTYIHTAERIHDNPVLKDRLRNFAEGNAKRTKQLQDELNSL
ncbi:hypothetical protein ACFSCX_17890 [Bacillus salitolerans]|uniref:Spore coat protein n=1 Tax=Bacillus salitolerans TaxID=1437434 RepID=A0ABW4LUC7_9BACI